MSASSSGKSFRACWRTGASKSGMVLARFTPLVLHDRTRFGFAESSRKRSEYACALPKLRKIKSSTPFARSAFGMRCVLAPLLRHREVLARCLDSVNDTFALQNIARFAEVIANIGLLSDPVDVTRDAFAEIDVWFVTGGPRQCGVAREVAHFAGAKFGVDLRRDVDLQNVGKLFRDFANRCAASAADIYGQAI